VKISIVEVKGRLEMKGLLISFVVGLLVGVLYGVIRVKSPAPPIIALAGLLGMVVGEQAGGGFLPKKTETTRVTSAHIVETKNHRQLSNGEAHPSFVD
jgi:XapX domain-containing protein